MLGTVPSPDTLKLPSLWSPWQRPSSPSEVHIKLLQWSWLDWSAISIIILEGTSQLLYRVKAVIFVFQNRVFDDDDDHKDDGKVDGNDGDHNIFISSLGQRKI